MERKNCFGYRYEKGIKYCDALMSMNCSNCKFFKTKQEYDLYVAPMEYRYSKN